VNPGVLKGGLVDGPADAARAFRAALEAMARPGEIMTVPTLEPPPPLSAAAAGLLLTLVDHETSLYLGGGHDTPEVREWLIFHTDVVITSATAAFWAVGDWASLQPLDQYPAGTPAYPDRSATLIVEQPTLRPSGTALRGPGIASIAYLNLPDADALKANARQFPRGVDCFFTAGTQVAALPRSTQIGEPPCTSQ
jgi:alpha-D-ribose 1-methylphosphonate 5-triphosphate synthase subunit PhnH